MKAKFIITLILFMVMSLVPSVAKACAPCNYPVVDTKAVSIATEIVQNGIQQIKKLIEINNTYESTYNKIGKAGTSAFDFMKASMKGNFEGKAKYEKKNATLTKWSVGDYKEADKVKSGVASLLKRIENLDSKTYKANVEDANLLVADATAESFSGSVAVRSMAKQMLQTTEDFKRTISSSSNLRDDIANSNLLALSNALYVKQMLELYANYFEVAVANVVREEASTWESNN